MGNCIIVNGNDNSNVYSTDEIIVGEWIDGKPIYRKLALSGVNRVNTNTALDVSTWNISRFINAIGSGRYTDYNQYINLNSATNLYWQIYYNADSKKICFKTSDYSISEVYLWIEYTKTTD